MSEDAHGPRQNEKYPNEPEYVEITFPQLCQWWENLVGLNGLGYAGEFLKKLGYERLGYVPMTDYVRVADAIRREIELMRKHFPQPEDDGGYIRPVKRYEGVKTAPLPDRLDALKCTFDVTALDKRIVNLEACNKLNTNRINSLLSMLNRAEAAERERDALFVQAVGWTWAEACSRVERGEDIRNVLIQRIFEGARDALRAQEPKP